jgi:hypothetical protein
MGEWKGKRDGVTERQRHGRMSSTFLLSFNATACRGDVKKKKKPSTPRTQSRQEGAWDCNGIVERLFQPRTANLQLSSM